jgi:hypothetical protein
MVSGGCLELAVGNAESQVVACAYEAPIARSEPTLSGNIARAVQVLVAGCWSIDRQIDCRCGLAPGLRRDACRWSSGTVKRRTDQASRAGSLPIACRLPRRGASFLRQQSFFTNQRRGQPYSLAYVRSRPSPCPSLAQIRLQYSTAIRPCSLCGPAGRERRSLL